MSWMTDNSFHFSFFFFWDSGKLLSLEDGTSPGSGQEMEGTKREGPSEYEIMMENKNKQVMSSFFVCV